jgi:UDP-D-galactose:(glucosyl)LPS alpha-1,6-D-galactosyltransferase
MDDPWQVVTSASALLLSSRLEGFPVVLLEALAHGVPIIAMDCPFGPREIVLDGINGWLVPDGDIGGMAKAIEDICSGRYVVPSAEAVRATAARFATGAVIGRMLDARVFVHQKQKGCGPRRVEWRGC